MIASGQGLHFANARGREVDDSILEDLDDSRLEEPPARGRGEADRRIVAIEPGSLLADSTGETFGYVRLPGPLFAGAAGRRVEPKCPFRIEVAPPQAYSVEQLCGLAGTNWSGLAAAAPKGKKVVVLLHGLTPFDRTGERPVGARAIGYSSKVSGTGTHAVDWYPRTDTAPTAAGSRLFGLGIGPGGRLGIDTGSSSRGRRPGKDLGDHPLGPVVRASADPRFAVALDLQASAHLVRSGPIGAAGVGWRLYLRNGGFAAFQQLLQTVTVPGDAMTLSLQVTTWIRWSCRSLGFGPRQWKGRPYSYIVELPQE